MNTKEKVHNIVFLFYFILVSGSVIFLALMGIINNI